MLSLEIYAKIYQVAEKSRKWVVAAT